MSEYITHIAVHDDARRLALLDPATAPQLREALRPGPRIGRLGAATSRGDTHTVPLLVAVRDRWPDQRAVTLLAFFFGWRCHIAADRQFKTIFRLTSPEVYVTEENDGPTSVSIAHDLFLLDEVYDGGRAEPFGGGCFGSGVAAAPLEPLFETPQQVELLEMQSAVSPGPGARLDTDETGEWLDLFRRRRQKYYVDTARYDAGVFAPDAAFVDGVVRRDRFYDRADPLIRIARAAQRGGGDGPAGFEAALEAAKHQSHYARALRRACLYNRWAAGFLAGELSVEALEALYTVTRSHATDEVEDSVHGGEVERRRLLERWHEEGFE